jgi:predicted MFS family arabinose efflux permease
MSPTKLIARGKTARNRELQSPDPGSFSTGVQWLLGTACGLLIANLYYAQPLTGLISASLGMPPGSSGLLVTLPLIGYGIGLLLVVPLGDLVENRKLVLLLVGLEALCMLSAGLITRPVPFLGVALLIGATACAVQILVPYVTYLAPQAARGQAVGKVVSGLMLGIMLARPVSSLVADRWSWRAIFRISAVLMALLFVALQVALPPRRPTPGLTYGALLRSLGRIFITTNILRRRAFYHASMFGAFSVFWTAAPLWLTGPRFGLNQRGVAWVALAGVAGAVAPPIAGRVADKGLSRPGTGLAMLLAAGAFLLSDLPFGSSRLALGLVMACAILLDFAVSANLVFGQRAIYSLGAEERSRLNGLYLATFFAGGAISSALSGWAYSRLGWMGVSALGIALPTLGLVYLATERQSGSKAAAVVR